MNVPLGYNKLEQFQSIISSIKNSNPNSEKDRIETLNKLHEASTISNHLIAKLLIQQDEILKKRYQDWKDNGSIDEYNQPKSVYQWVNFYKKELNFGEKQARRYIQLYEDTEDNPIIGEKLGTKKNELIRRVPEKYRNDLRQKTVENNWSAIKVEKEVIKIKDKETKLKTFKKIKPSLPPINIKLDKKNKNKIIIETDPGYRDTFNSIFQEKYVQKIRQEMYTAKIIVA